MLENFLLTIAPRTSATTGVNIDFGAGTVTEGGVYKYPINLREAPSSSVSIEFTTSKEALGANWYRLVSTFDTTNWSSAQVVSVKTDTRRSYQAKGSTVYRCKISTNLHSQDPNYGSLSMAEMARTLTVVSSGCGLGE